MEVDRTALAKTPLLDGELLAELAQMERLKPGRLYDLLTRFTTNRRAQVLAIRQALVSGDHGALRMLSHSLKGGALVLGLPRLAILAQSFESAGSATPSQIPVADELAALLEDSIGALSAWIDQHRLDRAR